MPSRLGPPLWKAANSPIQAKLVVRSSFQKCAGCEDRDNRRSMKNLHCPTSGYPTDTKARKARPLV